MPTSDTITDAVRWLYERHPYPHYPLLARPRWQEGYLASPAFAARLATDLVGVAPSDGATVLIAGGGEILPYVIRRLEPSTRRVISIDLSATSVRRAKLRIALAFGKAELRRGDINDYLAAGEPGQVFAHVDAYGVLHHLPNPSQTLKLLSQRLAPGGTGRLMVYNRPARDWIWQVQRLFSLLGYGLSDGEDLIAARSFLKCLGERLPSLGRRLAQIGPKTLANDARFADTFLHPREARLSLADWFDSVAAAGLTPFGLFDRYGELDDLPNPLWRMPTADELEERAADFRFENNLEFYVVKAKGGRAKAAGFGLGLGLGAETAPKVGASLPPKSWFTYNETRDMSAAMKWRLWRAHRRWTLTGKADDLSKVIASLPVATAMRLARLGAVLPGQIRDEGLRAKLLAPLAEKMEAPEGRGEEEAVSLARSRAADLVKDELVNRGRLTVARFGACVERLNRVQR